jgi:undecaprenyl-diphosphatase
LIVNGIILLIADRLKHRQGSVPLHRLSFGKGFLVGLVQVLALIPGFSRSGITMTAGLGVGLEYDEAARFAFLLATPIIAGAGILEVPKVLASHDTTMIHLGLLGGLLSGLVAFLSTAFLMHYFRTHEVRALRPFAYYCIVVGGVVSILAALGLHA